MKTSLIKGLNEQQKKEFMGEFTGSPVFRQRLIDLLNEKITSSQTLSRKKENYELPSWSLMQADSIGYERALNEVISLISSDSVSRTKRSQ